MPIYMRVPQQKGYVTTKHYQDWIEIDPFSLSIDRGIYATPGHLCNPNISSDIDANEIEICKIVDKISSAEASDVAWQSIGSVIINRVNNRRFKHSPKHHTVRYYDTGEVIQFTGFGAFTKKNIPYRDAIAFMTQKSTKKPAKIECLINLLKPIYFEHKIAIDAELYFSTKEQKRALKLNPKNYPEKPR